MQPLSFGMPRWFGRRSVSCGSNWSPTGWSARVLLDYALGPLHNCAWPVLGLGAEQRPVDCNAEFTADILCHTLAVAAQDLDADTLGAKRGSSAP